MGKRWLLSIHEVIPSAAARPMSIPPSEYSQKTEKNEILTNQNTTEFLLLQGYAPILAVTVSNMALY